MAQLAKLLEEDAKSAMSVVEQFPYRDRDPASAGLELMPDLPIVLRHQSRSLPCVGLVDSGAMISVLPFSLGIQLGLDWNSHKVPIALHGSLSDVGACGVVVEAVVGQLPPVRLTFAWARSDQVPCLLGQFNFFEVFDVCFFRMRKIFELRQTGG